jgi:hypothetical protein
VQIPSVKLGDDDGFGAAHAGMRSCVADLMTLYGAFMKGFNNELATGTTATDGIPLRQVSRLMSAHAIMSSSPQPSRNEASYGFGWARVQLPGRMGQLGINADLMPEGMPVVGRGVEPRLVLFHQGSYAGALAIAILLPDMESAIVVTSNALALTDVLDWVGQMVLEEVLDVPGTERNDFLAASRASVKENLKWCPDIVKALDDARVEGTSSRENLETYAGTYWDRHRIFKIVVTVEEEEGGGGGGMLYWRLQGLDSEKFPLQHYHHDTFT